ncbi:response regulator transcription factor [Dinghuibacter silviterrae]|uniref:DNA-binding NarL/FixJ family response regulator n=1 Tax=Dinghuibacter silviterrae TaxID=1539049 RepID=A0A4R8DWQ6_9BACT|nr:response regulator transcription factor [Dinghuibacter silviterrae]TDX01867.1 DNA-binding NarL/FixJ family response regulator [Dinghuibacter silviterrae]
MEHTLPSVALVDDHVLMRSGLAALIGGFEGFSVLFEADNGKDFIRQTSEGKTPDIVLLDIQMHEMDGYATAAWIKENLPETKVLALSMYDNDAAIIRMLRQGARGYVLKDIEPAELKQALRDLHTKGYYHTDMVTGRLINSMNQEDQAVLSEREQEFLTWACTELTYKAIADEMNLSPRTIDGYRDALFEKLHTKSRVGLVVYAIKHGIVRV